MRFFFILKKNNQDVSPCPTLLSDRCFGTRNSPASPDGLVFSQQDTMVRLQIISQELTFVVKSIFLEEKADLISTCDEIISIPLQDRTLTPISWSCPLQRGKTNSTVDTRVQLSLTLGSKEFWFTYSNHTCIFEPQWDKWHKKTMGLNHLLLTHPVRFCSFSHLFFELLVVVGGEMGATVLRNVHPVHDLHHPLPQLITLLGAQQPIQNHIPILP